MARESGGNKWYPLKEVLEAIEGDWDWGKNPCCKYVTLRVDSRDLHCRIFDRYGTAITLEELKDQTGKEILSDA